MMKLESIQGLKGIAALMVFFSHALCMPISLFYEIRNTPLHFFYDGEIAVMIFVTVGGFFYYKKGKTLSLKEYMGGVKRKMLRIFPAFFISMIIGYFLCNLLYELNYPSFLFTDWANAFWKQEVSFAELLKQISVLWPHNSDLINPPSWYIGMEVRLFLLIPILIMLCNTRYTSWRILIPLSLLVFVGSKNFYATCICGSLTRVIYNKVVSNRSVHTTLQNFVYVVLAASSLFLLNIKNEFEIHPSIAFAIQSLGACMLVLVVSLCNFKLLTNKILLRFADISYEFYLCHFSVLLFFRYFYHDFVSYVLFSFVSSILISIFINSICHKLILYVK